MTPREPRFATWDREWGQSVQAGRQRLGMKQAELATLLGITRTSVANIEAGRQACHAARAAHIAAVLGIEVPGWTERTDGSAKVIARLAYELARLRAKLHQVRQALDPEEAP